MHSVTKRMCTFDATLCNGRRKSWCHWCDTGLGMGVVRAALRTAADGSNAVRTGARRDLEQHWSLEVLFGNVGCIVGSAENGWCNCTNGKLVVVRTELLEELCRQNSRARVQLKRRLNLGNTICTVDLVTLVPESAEVAAANGELVVSRTASRARLSRRSDRARTAAPRKANVRRVRTTTCNVRWGVLWSPAVTI